jgi:hypothetical protein
MTRTDLAPPQTRISPIWPRAVGSVSQRAAPRNRHQPPPSGGRSSSGRRPWAASQASLTETRLCGYSKLQAFGAEPRAGGRGEKGRSGPARSRPGAGRPDSGGRRRSSQLEFHGMRLRVWDTDTRLRLSLLCMLKKKSGLMYSTVPGHTTRAAKNARRWGRPDDQTIARCLDH